MSSTTFNKPLKLQFKSSKILQTIIAIMHLLVAMIIIFMTQSLPPLALIFLLMTISASYYYFYHWHIARRLHQSILELHISSSGDWSIFTSTARFDNVIPLDSSFSSQYLLVINFNVAKEGKYTLVVAKDMLNNSEFRHLRVRLKTN